MPTHLTDPDSALMRCSDAHEYRQAYNAQAVVCADGTQLVLATELLATTADAPSFAPVVLGMERTIGLPRTVLADTGYASRAGVTVLQARGIEPLVAIGRAQEQRTYDFHPSPPTRTARRITEPWRLATKARLEQDDCLVPECGDTGDQALRRGYGTGSTRLQPDFSRAAIAEAAVTNEAFWQHDCRCCLDRPV